MNSIKTTAAPDVNPDPITGAPGAHPVGTVIRAVLGAIVGGLAGRGVAGSIEPTREDAGWRENCTDRPGIENESSFDDFGRVYGYGANAYIKYPARRRGDSDGVGS